MKGVKGEGIWCIIVGLEFTIQTFFCKFAILTLKQQNYEYWR